jgi:hypothetical protein
MRDLLFCKSVYLDVHHQNTEQPTELITLFMAHYVSVDSRHV